MYNLAVCRPRRGAWKGGSGEGDIIIDNGVEDNYHTRQHISSRQVPTFPVSKPRFLARKTTQTQMKKKRWPWADSPE